LCAYITTNHTRFFKFYLFIVVYFKRHIGIFGILGILGPGPKVVPELGRTQPVTFYYGKVPRTSFSALPLHKGSGENKAKPPFFPKFWNKEWDLDWEYRDWNTEISITKLSTRKIVESNYVALLR
jgi:hypothetical protein